MRRPFAAVAVLSTAAAALALAGCGSSTSPQTAFKSLNTSQQTAVENEAVIEVEANVGSFASFDPYGGFGFARVVPRRGSGLYQIIGGKAQGPRFQTSGGCQPTLSGNTTDEDSDQIPDNATATFNCISSPSAGDTVKESGTLSYSDPTPTTADLEYNASANLAIAEITSSSGDASLTLTGQSALTQSTGTLTQTGNAKLDFAETNAPGNGNGTVKFSTNNTATYTYSGTAPISFGQRPDGTFDLTGNWSYDVVSSQLTANLSFSISTPGGLSIKAACVSNSGNIDSGEIDLKFGDGTLVKATYSGCPATPTIHVN